MYRKLELQALNSQSKTSNWSRTNDLVARRLTAGTAMILIIGTWLRPRQKQDLERNIN
jgi:hypothetical protein